VKITGRKKEIIVTAGGKNVAPAVLEERLKSNRLVSQAMVVGDNRPFIGALITLEPDELQAFAKENELSGSVAELSKSEKVSQEIAKAVDHANAAVSKAESIRKVVILERDFTEENDELTPTLKLRRRNVVENFEGDRGSVHEVAGVRPASTACNGQQSGRSAPNAPSRRAVAGSSPPTTCGPAAAPHP
jgi:long-chain acyl-CoA synthetase